MYFKSVRLHFISVLSGVLFLAVTAVAALVYPENDPDVAPHLERKYFELKENDPRRSLVTEQMAQEIINDFFSFFELQKHPGTLQIEMDWSNPYLSAHAQMRGLTSVVSVWGGFLRAPGMSPMILAATLCHELGHVVGGAPYQTIKGAEFSTEGQSDFYSGLYCLPRFAKAFPRYFSRANGGVQKICKDQEDCTAVLSAGLATVQFMQKWSFQAYEPVRLEETAPEIQKYSPNFYPSFQCRLDIFRQAATCLRDQIQTCPPPPCWWPSDRSYPPGTDE